VAALALTWSEPHLAIGATTALFLTRPKSRPCILFLAGVLASAAWVAVSPAVNLEYFISVLPRQAASEVVHADQMSFTHILHLFGASDGVALRSGALSYAVATALGIAVSLRFALLLPAAIPLVPALFSLVGGTYIHEAQMIAALPVLFASRCDERYDLQLGAATALLAIPWIDLAFNSLVGQALVVAFLLLASATSVRIRKGVLAALPVIVFATLARAFVHPLDDNRFLQFHPHAAASAYASDIWKIWVTQYLQTNTWLTFVLCIPTWIGLGIAIFIVVRRADAPSAFPTSMEKQ